VSNIRKIALQKRFFHLKQRFLADLKFFSIFLKSKKSAGGKKW